MKKTDRKNKIEKFFHWLFEKLFLINDTPHKVSLGLGLGVFAGILPGTGPIAALFLAFICRANRAAALLRSLLTNTWLSFVTFLLAVKTGSAVFGTNWHDVYGSWVMLIKDFHWASLCKLSILKVILPIATGYIIISFCLGALAYLATFITIKIFKKD